MRRYTITLGATTTSGGRVITASSEGMIDGHAIALEGDLVSCPVCKTTARIVCVGPRIPEILNRKNVALDSDLCNCRCNPQPRLLTRQALRCQVIKDSGRALSNPLDLLRGEDPRAREDVVYSEKFVLVDDECGTPLANREYAVVRASGHLEFGVADDSGQTHLLSATAAAECVEIYAQGPVMLATLISPSGAVLHQRARRRTTPLSEALPKEVRVPGALLKRESKWDAKSENETFFQPPEKLSSAEP